MKAETIIKHITPLGRFDRFIPEASAREQFREAINAVCNTITGLIDHDRADELDKAVFSMLPKSLDSLPAEPKPEDFTATIQVLKQMANAYLIDKDSGLERKVTCETLQAQADASHALSETRAAEIVRLTVQLETANERLRLSELALSAAIQRLDTAKEKARDYVRELGDKTKFLEVDAL